MARRTAVLLVSLAVATSCHRAETPPERPSPVPLIRHGFPPDADRARRQLDGLTVARDGNGEAYQRVAFGETWTDETDAPGGRNGCDTRDDVLHRDLAAAEPGGPEDCVPRSGVLHDPYTGRVLPYSHRGASRIETEHVVALGAAWRAGAWAWTPEQRLTYANDLDVLLAVDGQANHDKSSRTPDQWKPRRAYWCEYGRRWTGIKSKYALTVTPSEKAALHEMLGTCP